MTDLHNLLGYVGGRPVWLLSGADDPVVEPDEPDDADPEPEPQDTWKPPTREEWERLQAAQKRAAGEAATRKRLLQQHGIDHRTGQKAVEDEPEPTSQPPAQPAQQVDRAEQRRQIEAAVAKAVAKVELRYKPALQANAVKAALDESGVAPQWRGLITKALDLSDLDYDENGNGIGLAEQLDALRLEYPSAWAEKTPKPAVKRSAGAAEVDGGRKPAPPAAKTKWEQAINAQMGF